jgi:hypothetical protein
MNTNFNDILNASRGLFTKRTKSYAKAPDPHRACQIGVYFSLMSGKAW